MKIADSIRLSVSAIRSGFLRSLLTILSLAVGVAAVLTVLALGDAGELRVEEEIVKLGVNKVWIRPVSERSALMMSDAQLINQAVQAPACAGAYTMTGAIHGRETAMIQVAGFDASASLVHAPKLLQGRMLNREEIQSGAALCLIDEALAEYFGGDMLGEYIRAGNRRFRVIGIIKPLSFQTLSAGNGMAVLPLQTVYDTFGAEVAEITVSVQPGQDASAIARIAADILGDEGYRTDTLEKEIGAAREIVRIFVMVLLCVAFVSMLSGGIGVMNVMLLSVRERQNEIGLIKAIGGTSGQIAALFLLEAAAYALLGGLTGVLLGLGLIGLFGGLIGLHATTGVAEVLPVLLGAALVGICFGVVPAIKAAFMQPVQALQRE